MYCAYIHVQSLIEKNLSPESVMFSIPVTVVVVSRLVYRKGVDLMAQVIADICPRYPQVSLLHILKLVT